MERPLSFLSFCSLIAGALFLFATNGAHAAVFDIGNGDVTGLKSAINTANTNGEDDTIELAANGNYILTTSDNYFYGDNGLPRIDADGGKKLTIHGNGTILQRSTANHTPIFRIFYVNNGASITILDLTISNGFSEGGGGAIDNDGAAVALTNCILTGNSADAGGGGIMNDGSVASATLTVNHCIFSDNLAPYGFAGAVLNFGLDGSSALAVSNSFFIKNSAFDGGGIVNYAPFNGSATATVNNSKFTHNSAEFGRGGAIHNETTVGDTATLMMNNCTINTNSAYFYGGGVGNSAGNAQINNCTFSENSAGSGGGIYNEYGGAIVQIGNCTLSGNSASFAGGGIYNDGDDSTKVIIINSTLSDNLTGSDDPSFSGTIVNNNAARLELGNVILFTAPSRKNISNSGGTVTSRGHNLSNDDGSGLLNASGDQINTDAELDPDGLKDNGGPTQTIALLPTSPAINAGDDANAPSTDQRGYLRSNTSDIGAFEFHGIKHQVVAVTHSGTNIVVTFAAVAGKTFRLERKIDIGVMNYSWQPVPGVPDLIPNTTGPAQFIDPDGGSQSHAFYRVELLP